ncbi:uncharacterized protein ACIB01_010002 isoform 1-T1 [Guaruba guarouba]
MTNSHTSLARQHNPSRSFSLLQLFQTQILSLSEKIERSVTNPAAQGGCFKTRKLKRSKQTTVDNQKPTSNKPPVFWGHSGCWNTGLKALLTPTQPCPQRCFHHLHNISRERSPVQDMYPAPLTYQQDSLDGRTDLSQVSKPEPCCRTSKWVGNRRKESIGYIREECMEHFWR